MKVKSKVKSAKSPDKAVKTDAKPNIKIETKKIDQQKKNKK